MKKIFLCLLCGVLLLGVTGCGNTTKNNNEKANNKNEDSIKTVVCTAKIEETDNEKTATMEFTYDKETLTLIEYKESVNQKLLENNTYKENFMNVINAYKEDTETINNDKEKYKGITATLDYDEENYSYTWTREYKIKQLSEENFDNLSIVLFVDRETFKFEENKMKEALEQGDSGYKCNW